MNEEKLQEILAKGEDDIVKELSVSSFDLPEWSDLVKEYDPLQHKIWDTAVYPIIEDNNGNDKFKRTAFGLQKLAVSRLAQAMFAKPVHRIYNYDAENEAQQRLRDVLEEIYRVRNSIDSENIERAKKLNACCQIATIWWVYERPDFVEGETTKYKLTHKTYAEIDGYKLFPILDQNNELLVLSIAYSINNVQHFDIYMNLSTGAQVRTLVKEEEWTTDVENSKVLEVFPVVYANLSQPVWQGQEGTLLVEALEEHVTYGRFYYNNNSMPTFALDKGDTKGMVGSNLTVQDENAEALRKIIRLGRGGSMKDVTWAGAGEAGKDLKMTLRNAFFEQVQIPDISFANLINSNTSAENKELLFTDSKMKARDLGGEWEKLFYSELEIVKGFIGIMFPQLKEALSQISIRSRVEPYNIKTKKENAEYISTAGDAMSTEVKVGILGEVDDISEEVDRINEERGAQINNL